MHLEHMAIVVDDYDAAIAFYVDVLGFELAEDSPAQTNDGRPKRWVVVRPPGARTRVSAITYGESPSVMRRWLTTVLTHRLFSSRKIALVELASLRCLFCAR